MPIPTTIATPSPWWMQILTEWGLAAVLVICGALFLGRVVWPWFVRKLDEIMAARERDLERHATREQESQRAIIEVQKGTLEIQERHLNALNALTEEIRSWRK